MKILTLILLIPSLGSAYIPQLDMIFDRTVKNHGNATYVVDTEVVIDSKDQTFLARESWIIEDADTLRVRVTGEKDIKSSLSLIRIYKNGKRYSLDDENKFKSFSLPEDFLEPLFFIRTVKQLEKTLINFAILPKNFSLPKPPVDINEPKYVTPSFLKLTRVGGVPGFYIGQPTPLGPALWIEQDQFVIRRVRLSNQTEIFADEYQKYASSIMLPQNRIVKWGGGRQAKIRILNVRTITLNPQVKELFTGKSLLEEKSKILPENGKTQSIDSVPEDPVLKDFYTRFR